MQEEDDKAVSQSSETESEGTRAPNCALTKLFKLMKILLVRSLRK